MSQLYHSYRRRAALLPASWFPIRPSVLLAALLAAMVFQSCEKEDSSVIDSFGYPPFLASGSVIPARINLDTIAQSNAALTLTVIARVTHPSGFSGIAQVTISLTDASGNDMLTSGELYDNGVFPDAKEGDSLYSGVVSVPMQFMLVGTYVCRIVAVSSQGYTSQSLLLPFAVERLLDRPPVLSDLQAPDTIVLGTQSQAFRLTVKATDPDGQSDIEKVFFNSFKPDGSPASGNPFLMYDDGSETVIYPPDGTSGDSVKGDSIYTLTVAISPTASLGTYRFEFQATDRSRVSSQKLIWNIHVVQ